MKARQENGIYGNLTKDNTASSKRHRALRHMECNPGWPLAEVIRKFGLSVMELRTAANGLVKIRVYADRPHNIVADGIWMSRADTDAALVAAV